MDESQPSSQPCGTAEKKKLARVYTVEFVAIGPKGTTSEMLTYLRSLKDLTKESIRCVQQIAGSFLVTFGSADIVKTFLERLFVVIGGKEYMVNPAGERRNWVVIKDLPFDFEDEDVLRFMEPFGKVYGVFRETYPDSDICTGDIFVVMTLDRNIPRFVLCDEFEVRVFHKGQDVLCYYCREKGHVIAECKELICHRCKRPGHFASGCPRASGRASSAKGTSVEPVGSAPVSEAVDQAWSQVVAKGKRSLPLTETPKSSQKAKKPAAVVAGGGADGKVSWGEQMDIEVGSTVKHVVDGGPKPSSPGDYLPPVVPKRTPDYSPTPSTTPGTDHKNSAEERMIMDFCRQKGFLKDNSWKPMDKLRDYYLKHKGTGSSARHSKK